MTIPFGKEFGLSKLSFCNTRINNLVERGTQDKKTCVAEMNTMENNQRLPELFDLYCDAGYECNSGRFLGMSESTKKEYLKDLDLFYKTFTGNDKRPEKIKRFGDIPMNTYNQDTMCDVPGISADAFTGSEHTYNYMNNLLIQYAENLRK